MPNHEQYMHRCLQLAALAQKHVAPNPMVGAVLVYNDQIIGEGFHQQYGQAHAEVNCLASVADEHRHLIPESTLYVSLEPCAHFGKTPPCADLIVREKIRNVIVASVDPFSKVSGRGIERIRATGATVQVGCLAAAAAALNKRFFFYHKEQRPYIILKWAASANGMVSYADRTPVAISSAQTNRLVHRWRAEEQAILIGAGTAISDDPMLNVRYGDGKHPVKLLIDPHGRVPKTNRLFNDQAEAIVYSNQLEPDLPVLPQVLNDAYERQLLSVLVEGGSKTLQAFIDANLWNEIRVIRSQTVQIKDGYAAPVLRNAVLQQQFTLGTDQISIYHPGSSGE